jgi:hypothetical protein
LYSVQITPQPPSAFTSRILASMRGRICIPVQWGTWKKRFWLSPDQS